FKAPGAFLVAALRHQRQRRAAIAAKDLAFRGPGHALLVGALGVVIDDGDARFVAGVILRLGGRGRQERDRQDQGGQGFRHRRSCSPLDWPQKRCPKEMANPSRSLSRGEPVGRGADGLFGYGPARKREGGEPGGTQAPSASFWTKAVSTQERISGGFRGRGQPAFNEY